MVDYNILSVIRNEVRGVSKVEKLGDKYKNLSKKIDAQVQGTQRLKQATQKINAAYKQQGEKYKQVSAGGLKRMIQLDREKMYAKKLNISNSQLQQGMKRMGYVLGADKKLHYDTGGVIKDQTVAQTKLIGPTKRFRMELLSVMFFGMALNKFFKSLTKGSMEASGAMDIWSTITMLIGLPVALLMTKVLGKLLGWFMKLPKGMRSAISAFVWLSVVITGALMIFGMMALGIDGILILLAKIGITTAVVSGAFASFKAVIVGAWAAVSGAVSAVAGVVGMTAGAFVAAIALIGVAIALLIKNWDDVKKGFLWFKDNIVGIITKPLDAIQRFIDLIKEMGGAVEALRAFLSPLAELFGAKMYIPKGFREKGIVGMQRGGIVTRPTPAIIGERGPEAVVPLTGGVGLGSVTYSPTINISANVTSEIDMDVLASRISETMYSDMRRFGIR